MEDALCSCAIDSRNTAIFVHVVKKLSNDLDDVAFEANLYTIKHVNHLSEDAGTGKYRSIINIVYVTDLTPSSLGKVTNVDLTALALATDQDPHRTCAVARSSFAPLVQIWLCS